MGRSRRLHWGIPATTLGGSPGERLNGLVLAVFFGGEFLFFCRPRAGRWWLRSREVHREEQLRLVDCRVCRAELRRRGLVENGEAETPLFPG